MKAIMNMHKHSTMQAWIPLIARVALALLFLVSGLGIAFNLGGTAGYYASVGIPAAMLVAVLVVIVKLAGSLMMIFGFHAREGALALFTFTLLATLIAHTSEGELINALKNIGIMGGLLLVALHGSGKMMSMQKHCVCPVCKSEHGNMNCTCGTCDKCRANA